MGVDEPDLEKKFETLQQQFIDNLNTENKRYKELEIKIDEIDKSADKGIETNHEAMINISTVLIKISEELEEHKILPISFTERNFKGLREERLKKFKDCSDGNLAEILYRVCDYCSGYDNTMKKCKYFICSEPNKQEALKRMKNIKEKEKIIDVWNTKPRKKEPTISISEEHHCISFENGKCKVCGSDVSGKPTTEVEPLYKCTRDWNDGGFPSSCLAYTPEGCTSLTPQEDCSWKQELIKEQSELNAPKCKTCPRIKNKMICYENPETCGYEQKDKPAESDDFVSEDEWVKMSYALAKTYHRKTLKKQEKKDIAEFIHDCDEMEADRHIDILLGIREKWEERLGELK
jgi:hypothetical protein